MSVDTPRAGVRAQRQAQTRARLVEVAREMFLADGFAATSIDKVAERAGFSKGAVYSNFANKDELCIAVLDTIHQQQIDGVVAVFAQPGTLDEKIDAFASWARTGLGQPLWVALESEFGASARSNSFVATTLKRRQREIRDMIAQLIESVTDQHGVTLTMPAQQAATILLGVGVGLGALRSIDHEIDLALFGDVMRRLLG